MKYCRMPWMVAMSALCAALITLSGCDGGEAVSSVAPAVISQPAASAPQAAPAAPIMDAPAVGQPSASQPPATTGALPSAPELPKSQILGDSCRIAGRYCIAVRFVSYVDAQGAPVEGQPQAIAHIRGVNRIWEKCGIGFELQSYEAVNPADYRLSTGARSEAETFEIRQRFAQNDTFLVVASGPWSGKAVAWTESPGSIGHGTILSSTVAGDEEVLAHELGHYLNLDHPVSAPQSIPDNIMNWAVSPGSTFWDSQCETARASAIAHWPAMLR